MVKFTVEPLQNGNLDNECHILTIKF